LTSKSSQAATGVTTVMLRKLAARKFRVRVRLRQRTSTQAQPWFWSREWLCSTDCDAFWGDRHILISQAPERKGQLAFKPVLNGK
jgi:hypothetical protein